MTDESAATIAAVDTRRLRVRKHVTAVRRAPRGQAAVRAAREGSSARRPRHTSFTWKNDDGSDSAVPGVDVIRVHAGLVAEKFAHVKG
jgi:hypothetical protein